MVQSALGSSQFSRQPTSLAERIAAEVPEPPEPTVSSMAERFAPEPQKNAQEAAGTLLLDHPARPPERRDHGGGTFANHWLFASLFFVSFIPAALLLGLVWYGALKLPEPDGGAVARVEAPPPPPPVSQQASVARVPAPLPALAPKLEVSLTAPDKIEAQAGEAARFELGLDASGPLPPESVIAVRAMPEGATLSQGRASSPTEWTLAPDEIGELQLSLPEDGDGETDLRIELVETDGTVMAAATTRLAVAPAPKSDLIMRADESDRIAGLIAHGEAMIDVGYFAGARAYFQRAAEAGSGDAALRLGATYDPAFIEALAAQGIKPEPDAAEIWYERAGELGVTDQETKLDALREVWTSPAEHTQSIVPAQTAFAEPARLAPATAAAKPAQPDSSSGESTLGRLMAAAGLGKDEWVEVSSPVNLRAEPSSTAETLRVVQKGAKLRATDRQGNWVQVTDPATSEVGWIYSRFVATADAPAR